MRRPYEGGRLGHGVSRQGLAPPENRKVGRGADPTPRSAPVVDLALHEAPARRSAE